MERQPASWVRDRQQQEPEQRPRSQQRQHRSQQGQELRFPSPPPQWPGTETHPFSSGSIPLQPLSPQEHLLGRSSPLSAQVQQPDDRWQWPQQQQQQQQQHQQRRQQKQQPRQLKRDYSAPAERTTVTPPLWRAPAQSFLPRPLTDELPLAPAPRTETPEAVLAQAAGGGKPRASAQGAFSRSRLLVDLEQMEKEREEEAACLEAGGDEEGGAGDSVSELLLSPGISKLSPHLSRASPRCALLSPRLSKLAAGVGKKGPPGLSKMSSTSSVDVEEAWPMTVQEEESEKSADRASGWWSQAQLLLPAGLGGSKEERGARALIPQPLVAVVLLLALALTIAFLGFWLGTAQVRSASDDGLLRLNEVQVLGSWRSYHVAPSASILAWLSEKGYDELVEDFNFTHPTIGTQLEGGYRFVGLDTYDDPLGGFFLNPDILSHANLSAAQLPPELALPGFKVMNFPDVDFQSSCILLTDCLKEVWAFSRSHPGHVPITVMLNFRSDKPTVRELQGSCRQPNLPSQLNLLALEAEILQVMDRASILTPDDVRGEHKTLADAIQKGASVGDVSWPTVQEAAGKILFLLTPEDAIEEYRQMGQSLEGRLLFTARQTTTKEGLPYTPDQAVVVMEAFDDTMAELVATGHMVVSPLNSVRSSLEAYLWDRALHSGCQVIGVQDLWVDPGIPPFKEASFPPPPPPGDSDGYGDFPELDSLVIPSLRTFGTEPQAQCNIVLDPTACQLPVWAELREPIPEQGR